MGSQPASLIVWRDGQLSIVRRQQPLCGFGTGRRPVRDRAKTPRGIKIDLSERARRSPRSYAQPSFHAKPAAVAPDTHRSR